MKLARIKLAAGPQKLLLDRGVQIAKDSAVDAAPKWNKLCVAGKFYRADFPGGSLNLDRTAFEQMISNWKRMGGQALPVDRHHWGDSNDTSVSAEDKGAVGWIEDLRIGPDGDLEGLIQWNDDGREDITKDRRRYFSPTFSPTALDRRTNKQQGWTLYGGGLLNDPFLTDLPRMAASATPTPARKDTNTMDKILLAALLGLSAETATEDAIKAKILSLKQDGEKQAAELVALRAEKVEALKLSAGLDPLKVQLAAVTTEKTELAAKLAKIETERFDEGVKSLGAELLRDGRVIAAAVAPGGQVEVFAKKTSLAEARTFFAAFPKGGVAKVEVETGTTGGAKEEPATKDDAVAAYQKLMDGYAADKLSPEKALAKLKKDHPAIFKLTFTPTAVPNPAV